MSNWKEYKKQIRAEKAEARKTMINPFKIGQIMYDTWGYEQTNVNFYQVIEVKERSIVIREIGASVKLDGPLAMSGRKFPEKDLFISAPMVKLVQVGIRECEPKIFYYIKSEYGWIQEYGEKENGVSYSSWA